MQRIIMQLSLVFAAVLISACGGGRIYQVNDVKPVQKVAVIAVEVLQPSEFDLFKPDNSVGEGPMANTTIMLAKESKHVGDYYVSLQNGLRALGKFRFASTKRIRNNPSYRKWVKETTEGFQSVTPIPKNTTRYRAPGMLGFDAIHSLGQKGRDELIRNLKVDALVVAQYNITLSGTTIMGIGSRYPQADLRFFMYKAGVDKPIWRDNVRGKSMEESVGKTRLSLDFNKIQKLSLESAKTAYLQLKENTKIQQ